MELLREPFPAHQISKLPKPTKAQTDEVRQNFKAGIRCQICGGWHHPKVVHLDYVGHAALTDRLLDCDASWNWEPVATNEDGTPKTDENGGMWIKLTICDVTRLGYGHPDGKRGGDAIKEVIGDALRNAAMRFGAALDLWHKGDLHVDDPAQEDDGEPMKEPQTKNNDKARKEKQAEETPFDPPEVPEKVQKRADEIKAKIKTISDLEEYGGFANSIRNEVQDLKVNGFVEIAAHIGAAMTTKRDELSAVDQ